MTSDDIAACGNAKLARLTVLKKWFDQRGRLPSFAIWVASRASSGKAKTGGEAAELFRQARALLARLAKLPLYPASSEMSPNESYPKELLGDRVHYSPIGSK